MSGWLAAAAPPALVEGEDDALVHAAAFQLAVGLGGLLHGHGLVRAQAEPAVAQQTDRPCHGTGAPARRGLGGGERGAAGGGGGGGGNGATRRGPACGPRSTPPCTRRNRPG